MKDFLLIIITVMFNTCGQFLLKFGMKQVGRIGLSGGSLLAGFLKAATTPFVFGGLALYVASAGLWMVVLSRVNLSWAFPLVSMSYVLVALLSPVLIHERFSLPRLIGTLVICAGVALVARTPSN